METFYFITGILLFVSATFLLFKPLLPASFVAYFGLWLLKLSKRVWLDSNQLIFWGMAVLLLMLIDFIGNKTNTDKHLRNYINIGTIAGTLLGIISFPNATGLMLGAFTGAVLGAFAFAKTPKGRISIKFPSSDFFHYLCIVGLPAIVTTCIIFLPLLTYMVLPF